MLIPKLKNRIKKLPAGPGIYLFKNSANKPLYIGKALNLKNRIKSYTTTEDVRLKKMLSDAHKLEFIETNSDIEALILESQLIKKFRPPFNIVLKDDKQYAFVGFTEEKYPRIFITHQPTKMQDVKIKNQNWKLEIRNWKLNSALAEFVGPFTDIGALKITLRYLRRVFPYCTCRQLHHNYCLNYHIGKCMGVCCLKKPVESIRYPVLRDYKKNITAIKDILNGKRKSLVKNLEKEMKRSAKRGDLEKAIESKERLKKLKRVLENAKIIQESSHTHISIYGYDKHNNKKTENSLIKIMDLPKTPVRIEGYDVSNIQGAHATGAMVTFVNGQPEKSFYRKFKIKTKQTPDDTAMLKEILERRFKHSEWPFPDLILIDGGRGQVNTAIKTLRKMAIKIPIIGISKNEHHLGHQLIIPGRKTPLPLTKLHSVDKNLLLTIDSEAHRFAINYYREKHRRSFLVD